VRLDRCGQGNCTDPGPVHRAIQQSLSISIDCTLPVALIISGMSSQAAMRAKINRWGDRSRPSLRDAAGQGDVRGESQMDLQRYQTVQLDRRTLENSSARRTGKVVLQARLPAHKVRPLPARRIRPALWPRSFSCSPSMWPSVFSRPLCIK
jgi:hypothetical protein